MNQKSKTLKGSWLPSFRWGKRKVRNDDVEHIPTQVALEKVSRSVIEEDLTLESGEVFTHNKSSESGEHLDLIAPPCHLREMDETRADNSSDIQVTESVLDLNERAHPTYSSPKSLKKELENKATSGKTDVASEKKAQKSTVPIVAVADATTIALSVWTCW
jgi:hypothetical protein